MSAEKISLDITDSLINVFRNNCVEEFKLHFQDHEG